MRGFKMALTVSEKKKYTYDDYLKTPDDERYELIEGELMDTNKGLLT